MASIIINCLVVRRDIKQIITVSGFMCRISRASTSRSPFSLCALALLAAGNRYTRLFITGAQIRFPFARNREMTVEVIRTYQDVVAEIERYSWRAWQSDREKSPRFKAPSKEFGKLSPSFCLVSQRYHV